jgi:hypothetical protein
MRKPIDEETNAIILVAIVAIACLVWYLFKIDELASLADWKKP